MTSTDPPNALQLIENHVETGHFQRSLSFVVAGSGLVSALEVSLEHYRGSFGHKVMYSPVVFSLILAAAGLGGTFHRRLAKTVLPLASWALVMDGVIGFGFHVRGISRKPGGWNLPVTNIVMGPPIFAPLLLTIGGFLGIVASKLAPEESHQALALRDRSTLDPAQLRKLLSSATAVSGLLNGFEALYSHYKSRFKVPAQWIPVVLTPPIVIAAVGGAVNRKVAKRVLAPVSMLGIAAGALGFFYHTRATLKKKGFKERPLYHLVYGPPVFAPLLFAATGFLGVLAGYVEKAPAQKVFQ